MVWVLAPFIALSWANRVSKHWSSITRVALDWGTLLIALSCLVIYANASLRPPKAQAASGFIAVPPASWLIIGTFVPFLALLSGRKTPRPRWIMKSVTLLALFVSLTVWALFALLWLERRSELALPAPTGPFAVGRVIYVWKDDTNIDTMAPVPGTKRELLVWIWYPATGESRPMTDYLPAQVRMPVDRADASPLKFLTRDLSKVLVQSIDNADVSPKELNYPVVIMRAGASASVVNYSTLATDLASHGYIVVGFDAPYRTSTVVFPDGRVVNRLPQNDPEQLAGQADMTGINKVLVAWTADMAFVIDRLEQLNTEPSGKFTGRLDTTRVGVFGHSFGGAQALQFCHDDPRCKAGIDIDGRPLGNVVQEGIRQPFLFVVSAQIHSSDAESRQVKAEIDSIYRRLPVDGRLFVAIRGANHYTFSDDGAFLKSALVRQTLRIFGMLKIDGRRQVAVTASCLHDFFDAFLKNKSDSRLKISPERYPEIEFIEWRDE